MNWADAITMLTNFHGELSVVSFAQPFGRMVHYRIHSDHPLMPRSHALVGFSVTHDAHPLDIERQMREMVLLFVRKAFECGVRPHEPYGTGTLDDLPTDIVPAGNRR